MMKVKRILYVGNDLATKTKYHSSMETLSSLLQSENYIVFKTSSKQHKLKRLLTMLWVVFKMRKRADYVLIDTFSTTNFYYALIISQLARVLKLKYIPILHGGNLPNRLDTSPYFSKLLFKNSYQNSAPSTYLQQEFKKRGFETLCIPNAISIKEYDYKNRTKIKPRLFWVRAFDKTYNPTLAIKVLALLKKQGEEVTLCMVGPDKDGSLRDAKVWAQKLNVSKNVIFTGVLPKEEWHQLSNKYDVFINTTNVDNMPVSIIEAMALGFPIVSTNAGGLPFLIEHEVDGILVPVNNESKMANAIINLIHNPKKASELSKNARKKAANFDTEIVKQQWLTLLT